MQKVEELNEEALSKVVGGRRRHGHSRGHGGINWDDVRDGIIGSAIYDGLKWGIETGIDYLG